MRQTAMSQEMIDEPQQLKKQASMVSNLCNRYKEVPFGKDE
jgi:hypothetical protein